MHWLPNLYYHPYDKSSTKLVHKKGNIPQHVINSAIYLLTQQGWSRISDEECVYCFIIHCSSDWWGCESLFCHTLQWVETLQLINVSAACGNHDRCILRSGDNYWSFRINFAFYRNLKFIRKKKTMLTPNTIIANQ